MRAYDRLHRLRKAQHARAFIDKDVADVARQMAGDLGLDCEAPPGGPRRPLALQHGQSDFELLLELAAQAGLHLRLEDQVLRLADLGGEGEAAVLTYGRELLEASVTLGGETLRRASRVEALGLGRIATFAGAADRPRSQPGGAADVGLDAFPDLGERVLTEWLADDRPAAVAMAQADLDRAAAATAVFEGLALGDPRLRPGRRVQLKGVSATADHTFGLACAVHTFDVQRGYVTHLSTAPPLRPVRRTGVRVTVGQISAVDDPEGLSRARARLPACGGLETGWMQVLAEGAGDEKGLAVFPEPGDDVLVLAPDGDFARALILGGLYGERAAPLAASASRGKARPLGLATAAGQRLTLDSVEARASLATGAGDVFELTPDGARLHATQDLVIEAPGRSLTIRARSVSFEQG